MAPAKNTSSNFLELAARLAPRNSLAYLYKHTLSAPLLRSITDRALLTIVSRKVTIPEGVLYLDPSDPVISGALTLGIFESFETNVFRQLLQPGMVVADIGANIGYYSIIAARHVGEKGMVYAFEPEPVSRSFLEKNVRENDYKNVQISDVAVGDKQGTVKLHVSKTNKGNHSIVPLKRRAREFSKAIDVATISFDGFCKQNHISSVDLVKIDVEGAEELVLKGMQDALRQPTITLCIEFFPDALRDAGSDPIKFLDTLASYGFSLFLMNGQSHRLDPITNFSSFVDSFPKKEYCNLLCTKDHAFKFLDK
jgi:FkbM family methyltransferase